MSRLCRLEWIASVGLLVGACQADGGDANASDTSTDDADDTEGSADDGPGGEGSGGPDDGDSDETAGPDDGQDDTGGTQGAVNWHEHVAPIVIGNCSGCHRDGGIAPFSFETYEAAAPLAPAMAIAAGERTMPPFAADQTDECTLPHPLRDDLRLSDEDIALLAAWADDGAPEGDPALAAELPEPPSTELENPDLVIPIGTSLTVEGTQDRFICFSLDPGLDADQFISALQVIPGNDAVVHHVLIYEDETGSTADSNGPDGWFECSQNVGQGQLIAGWAPGGLPLRMPDGVGRLIEADSRIVLNVHYHPTAISSEIDDATAVAFKYFEGTPDWVAGYRFIGNAAASSAGLLPGDNDDGGTQFRIPAGEAAHVEEMLIDIHPDEPLSRQFRIATHMHYLGVEMLLRVMHSDGSEECLIHTPRFDFNWQRGYIYDAPIEELPTIQGGDQVYLRCTYDNTLGNPALVQALQDQGLDEPVDVYFGDDTLDEMCLGTFGFVRPN